MGCLGWSSTQSCADACSWRAGVSLQPVHHRVLWGATEVPILILVLMQPLSRMAELPWEWCGMIPVPCDAPSWLGFESHPLHQPWISGISKGNVPWI